MISRLFAGFCRLCFLIYSQILLTASVRASGASPMTAASSFEGVSGAAKNALFFAGALGAAALAGAFVVWLGAHWAISPRMTGGVCNNAESIVVSMVRSADPGAPPHPACPARKGRIIPTCPFYKRSCLARKRRRTSLLCIVSAKSASGNLFGVDDRPHGLPGLAVEPRHLQRAVGRIIVRRDRDGHARQEQGSAGSGCPSRPSSGFRASDRCRSASGPRR